jgi:hypothetical protein
MWYGMKMAFWTSHFAIAIAIGVGEMIWGCASVTSMEGNGNGIDDCILGLRLSNTLLTSGGVTKLASLGHLAVKDLSLSSLVGGRGLACRNTLDSALLCNFC